MSVESEILRIQHNVADSYAAVAGKGGTVPLQPTSANLAAAVASIPQTVKADNNPVGTVISFMGQTAPDGYLACDGAEYSISAYPALAALFAAEFGAANHFGGDGTATFAVPDMRNLFLRGYHGEAGEQLSGEVGAKQEGTVFPALFSVGSSGGRAPSAMTDVPSVDTQSFEYPDTCEGNPAYYTYFTTPVATNVIAESGADIYASSYTSRPVNMAVLYCIKAVERVPPENRYSTEETRIGTWIDGKPIYRKTLILTSPSNNAWLPVYQDTEIGFVVKEYGILKVSDTDFRPLSELGSAAEVRYAIGEGIQMFIQTVNYAYKPVFLTVEYTKTTD